MPDSPLSDLEQSPIPHHTKQVARLTLGNSRDSLRNPSQIERNTNFSTGTRAKLHGRHIISRRERLPRILLKRKANFPQAPQEYPFLSNRYVRGTLSLLPQVEWKPRCPDSKEGRISLQLLECRLIFLTQHEAMYESPVETLEIALGARLIWTGSSHPLTLREAREVHCFKR